MGRVREAVVSAAALAVLGATAGCNTAASAIAPSPTATATRPPGPAAPLPPAGSAPPLPPAASAGRLPRAGSPAPPQHAESFSPDSPARITYAAAGSGRWTTAPAQRGPAAGEKGRKLRYRVAVERDIHGLTVPEFADTVTATLSDPRGWTAGGRWRLLRVGPRDPHDFTIYLATPATRDRLCDSTDGYTSCRNGDSVVLNVARWAKGAPRYGASLATYRQYLVNHEVGHRLGNGHELCPGSGRPAPLMQQQTLGLHGCTANPWPYLNGKRYTGRSGTYHDKVPPRDRGQS